MTHPFSFRTTLMRTSLLALAALPLVAGSASAQDKVGTTAAAFLGIGVGARAMAMGESQVAAASGPSALYWLSLIHI